MKKFSNPACSGSQSKQGVAAEFKGIDLATPGCKSCPVNLLKALFPYLLKTVIPAPCFRESWG